MRSHNSWIFKHVDWSWGLVDSGEFSIFNAPFCVRVFGFLLSFFFCAYLLETLSGRWQHFSLIHLNVKHFALQSDISISLRIFEEKKNVLYIVSLRIKMSRKKWTQTKRNAERQKKMTLLIFVCVVFFSVLVYLIRSRWEKISLHWKITAFIIYLMNGTWR